ncbi:MAG: MobF family relaxase [Thermofilaceae archaeon]
MKRDLYRVVNYLNNEIEESNYYSEGGNVYKRVFTFGEGMDDVINMSEEERFVYLGGRKRIGIDFTVSFDKSVSLLAFVDERVREACRDVVAEVVKRMSEGVLVRVTKNDGERVYDLGKGCVFSVYEHLTSRELDPQLHFHCLLHNKVYYDGKFYAVQADYLVENKFYFNVLLNYELMRRLQDLGYVAELDSYGNVKVMMSNEVVKKYSKRTEILKDYLKGLERRAKEIVKLATRRRKEGDLDEEKLKEIVKSEALEVKKRDYTVLGKLGEEDLVKAYEMSIEELTEKRGFFTKESLVQSVLINLSNISKEKASKVIELEKVENFIDLKMKELMWFRDKGKKFERFYHTTVSYYKVEGENIDITRELLKSKKEIASEAELIQGISEFEKRHNMILTKEQRKVVESILNGRQVTLIQGFAGTGKTASAKCSYEIAKTKGYKFVALSATGKAAEELGKAIGSDKAMTVDSFLSSQQKEKIDSKTILFVDEAGMLSSKKANELLKIAKETNAKIVFQGDVKQLKSVEAGDFFNDLFRNFKDDFVILTDIRRQKKEKYRELTKAIAMKDFYYVINYFAKNKDSVVKEKIDFDEIAKSYKNDTLIVATKNSTKNILNEKIRENLKGEINKEKTFKVANKIDVKSIEDLNENCFYIAQNGKAVKIKKVDKEKNTITFENNKTVYFTELKNKDNFYELKEKKLGVGDRIIALKNDKYLNVKNGEMFYVKDIKGDNIVIENDYKKLTVNMKKYNFFDYGYCITTYKSQGMSVKNVIAIDDTNMNYNHFYVAISRGKENFTLYTNDLVATLHKAQFEQRKITTQSINNKDTTVTFTFSRSDIANILLTHNPKEFKYTKYIDNKNLYQEKDKIQKKTQEQKKAQGQEKAQEQKHKQEKYKSLQKTL